MHRRCHYLRSLCNLRQLGTRAPRTNLLGSRGLRIIQLRISRPKVVVRDWQYARDEIIFLCHIRTATIELLKKKSGVFLRRER